jgi:lactate racemase
MAHIDLRYGNGSLPFEYDEERFQLLLPKEMDETPLSDLTINAAISNPIDAQPLEEIISPAEKILIVVSDATRATASAQVVNILVRRLVSLGVTPSDISILFSTGIHRPVTDDEKRALITDFIFQRVKCFDHDAYDQSQLVNLGITDRGIPIEVNRRLVESSHVILTGGITFHYFAGFTGGRKSICPGLSSARSIEATHMLAMDFERGGRRRGVGAGRLDGNAVHEECEKIAAEIAPSFLINTVTDHKGQAMRIYAGDWRMAHRRGCAEYSEEHVIKIEEKRPLVIAGCGGFPSDINMIQAHKALDVASHACTEGGDIVLLAECADGLGRSDFEKWFDAKNSVDLEQRLRESYEVNGQTAWSLLSKAERFRVHMISNLPYEIVKKMGMNPIHDLEQFSDRSESGYILPSAKSLPVVSNQGDI